MEFSELGLEQSLLSNIAALGYSEPTPIQQQALPAVLAGNDVIGLAETGTGKTAAFALPMLHSLLQKMGVAIGDSTRGGSSRGHEGRRPVKKVRGLIIAPTRELVDQIYESLGALGKGTGLSGVTLYGGVPFSRQLRKLQHGVDIIVACPGRLLDHLRQETVDLSGVQMLVLDEADHMFDMGFLPTVRQIMKFLPSERQTMLFSATMPPEVRSLAEVIVKNPVTVKVGSSGLSRLVEHALYPVADTQKTPLLLHLVGSVGSGSVIVFTRTKHRAKRIGEALSQGGFTATSLQGNLSQSRRHEAIDGFRGGRYKVMVATDIAARGIDVSKVSHVINYDAPDTVEAYTHRTGRTGRASRSGDALTFVTRGDRSLMHRIERELKLTVKALTVPEGLPVVEQGASSGEERRERRPQSGGGSRGRERTEGRRGGYSSSRESSSSRSGSSSHHGGRSGESHQGPKRGHTTSGEVRQGGRGGSQGSSRARGEGPRGFGNGRKQQRSFSGNRASEGYSRGMSGLAG